MTSSLSTASLGRRQLASGAAWLWIVAGVGLLIAGCRPAERTGPPAKPYPSIVAPLPAVAVAADQGFPGTWEALDEIEPGIRAFVVGPPETEPAVGVVLVPTAWGIGREVRDLARALAARGFAVVVPDVLEGVEATSRLGMRELAAGLVPARVQDAILASLKRLQSDLGGKPVTLVALGSASAWAIGLGERARPFSAIAFDTAALSPADLEALAAIGRPALALFGDNSSAYPVDRRIALDEQAHRLGLPLELYPVPGAGSELFDSRASSFYPPAYDEALTRLEAFLRALPS